MEITREIECRTHYVTALLEQAKYLEDEGDSPLTVSEIRSEIRQQKAYLANLLIEQVVDIPRLICGRYTPKPVSAPQVKARL